ncbi:SusC/RagA family TonB-linked outer membrane protein [Chitinophaga lutea]|nr:SusC/RagA family TonB-linked outer membrane protein [Chitinophaga lutea]
MLASVLFVTAMLASASSRGQLLEKERVTASFRNESLESCMRRLRLLSGVEFAYNPAELKQFTVSVQSFHRQPLGQILSALLASTPLSFREMNNSIVIFSREEGPVQEKKVTGTVRGSTGELLPSVTVRIKGKTAGTVTDKDGAFSLDYNPGDVLVFSLLGYVQKEAVPGRGPLHIVLMEENAELKEVVVVGYGEQRKRTVTGAIGTVDAKEIQRSPVVKASDALAGRVPGLIAVKNAGGPGRGSDLYIRGFSTFNSGPPLNSAAPLIVIDGIPGRNLDMLDPSEIDNVSVLKDASASSVYGARAANGVILVTTKKGNRGQPAITLNSGVVMQKPTRQYHILDSYNYALLLNEAHKNEGTFNPAAGRGYNDADLQKLRDKSDPDQLADTDWYDEILNKQALQTQHNLSVSGGSEKTRYYAGAGYAYEGGLFDLVNFRRYNMRLNLESRIGKNLVFNLNTAGMVSKARDMGAFDADYVVKFAMQSPRIYPNRFSNGLYNYIPSARGNMYLMSRGDNGTRTTSFNLFTGSLSLQYNIPFVEGLSAKGTLAYDKQHTFAKRWLTPYAAYTRDAAGNYFPANTFPAKAELRETYYQYQTVISELSLQYNRYFGKHHVSGLLLFNHTSEAADSLIAARSNFSSPALDQLNLGDPTQATNAGTAGQRGRIGYVGRLTYNFSEKYLFEFNFRYDGSNIFPPGHQYGFFPSVSAGWRISEEPFFKPALGVVPSLKLRGSYGLAGNDAVFPYQFLSTYNLSQGTGGYSFGGASPQYSPGLNETILPNPDFTWEKTRIGNIGLDAAFLDNRFTLETDYFVKHTYDILIPPTQIIASTLGISLPPQNAAEVESRGVELQLGYNDRRGALSWRVRPNATFLRNKVLKYAQATSVPAWQRVEGRSVSFGSVTGYTAQGIYQTEEEIKAGPTPLYPNVKPGDIRYADIDGDNKITAADRSLISKGAYPNILFGADMGVYWKGIELNLLWQGVADRETHFSGTIAFPFSGDGVPAQQHLDRWTPENKGASFPRLWINNQNNSQNSTFWLRNTSYLRLKNLELAYNLPQTWLRPIGLSRVRVYVSGLNLLTFSSYKLTDPEISAQGAYPLMRYYNAGATVNF